MSEMKFKKKKLTVLVANEKIQAFKWKLELWTTCVLYHGLNTFHHLTNSPLFSNYISVWGWIFCLFQPSYIYLSVGADTRIQLPSTKPDITKICKNVRQCHSSHHWISIFYKNVVYANNGFIVKIRIDKKCWKPLRFNLLSLISRYNPHEQKLFGAPNNLEHREIPRPKPFENIDVNSAHLHRLSVRQNMYV